MPQELEELLAGYRRAWSDNSPGRIESFWDSSQSPLYKAEEIQHYITSWDELRAYWQHNETFNSVNELSYADINTHAITDDVLLLGMRMRWDIQFAEHVKNMDGSGFAWAGQTMGGDNHVLACLRNADGDWKFTAWVEAPDAPILYMADLYRKNVRPDFPAC